MCKEGNEYTRLNPNEVGILMLDWICRHYEADKGLPQNPIFMKTIVTSSLGEKIAQSHSVNTINTLTGFKYIGEQIEALDGDQTFIFAMEESCGYLSNHQIRDKDGVNAALLLCRIADEYKRSGLTHRDRMVHLYEQYGYYLNTQISYQFNGGDGADKMAEVMKKITWPLAETDGIRIVDGVDYSEGFKGLPPANMREYKLSDGSRFLIRPSGTEPKLKVYIEGVGKIEEKAKEKAERIKDYVSDLLEFGNAR